jgi:hypothetical protein
MASIAEYVAKVQTRFEGVARSELGEEFLARNSENRYAVWVLLYDEFEGPQGGGRSGTGKQIHTRVATFVVRLTGSTLEETEMLRASLITAAGIEMGGRTDKNYRLGRAEWRSRSDNVGPHVCDQTISLVVPFFAVDLPPGPSPQDAADNVFVDVVITAREIESFKFGTLP